MTIRRTLFGLLAVMAMPVAAQDTRALTDADSAAVARAAVRAALASYEGAHPMCVTNIGDSLATQAGRAFITEGHAVAAMMRSPDDSAGHLDVTLVALAGRDTVRVVLRLDGDDGLRKRAGWMNRIEYNFTRDSTSALWRFISQRALYFADYILDHPARVPRPSCLNGHRL
jgi:hypothetical protein